MLRHREAQNGVRMEAQSGSRRWHRDGAAGGAHHDPKLSTVNFCASITSCRVVVVPSRVSADPSGAGPPIDIALTKSGAAW